MSELSPTQTGNAGPVDELTRKRMNNAYLDKELRLALAWMEERKLKLLYQRDGTTPGEKWADKREES